MYCIVYYVNLLGSNQTIIQGLIPGRGTFVVQKGENGLQKKHLDYSHGFRH